MKKLLLLLLVLGLIWVACQKKEPTPTVGRESSMQERADAALQTAAEKTKEAAATVAEKSKELAADAKAAWDRKRVDWHLTDSEIKSDLDRSGRVIREKSAVAGQKIGAAVDNARIVGVIKSKFLAEPDLSVLKIGVEADHGVVTLTGSVKSLELVGRATGIALDTDGVTRVVSLLRVEP